MLSQITVMDLFQNVWKIVLEMCHCASSSGDQYKEKQSAKVVTTYWSKALSNISSNLSRPLKTSVKTPNWAQTLFKKINKVEF